MRLFLLPIAALHLPPADGFHRKLQHDDLGAASVSDCYAPYDHKPLLRLAPCTEGMAGDMNRLILEAGCVDMSSQGILVLPPGGGCAEGSAVCDVAAADRFMATFGGSVSIVMNDTGGYYRESSGVAVPYREEMHKAQWPWAPNDGFYQDWRDLEALQNRVDGLVSTSHLGVVGLASFETIGESYEGRDIKAVRIIGADYEPGNGRKLLLTFQMHAREWISGMSGVFVVEHFITEVSKNPHYLHKMELVIVPMSNPDGFQYSHTTNRMWRKNRNPNAGADCIGVDLNRNWPVDWGGGSSTSTDECSEVFVGKGPCSEPESKTIRSIIDEPGHVDVHIDFHSYSEMILEPWSYSTDRRHPKRNAIDSLVKAMKNKVGEIRGTSYTTGGSEILYPASGVMPDYVSSKGGFGLTVELSPNSKDPGGFMLAKSHIKSTCMEALACVRASIEWLQRNPDQPGMAGVLPMEGWPPLVPWPAAVPVKTPTQPVVPQPVVQVASQVQMRAPLQPMVPVAPPMQVGVPMQSMMPAPMPMQAMMPAPMPMQVGVPMQPMMQAPPPMQVGVPMQPMMQAPPPMQVGMPMQQVMQAPPPMQVGVPMQPMVQALPPQQVMYPTMGQFQVPMNAWPR